ncbi:MFS transporter [Aeromicrobium duanguangcaii]|uniref:MFS transporter n=1 Tax=Aeromicrobium duanguangcaii TaxID=2968086 RepID=UPI0020180E1F|nr:MFS transporter [Aeromicrobium duanguangcaii]
MSRTIDPGGLLDASARWRLTAAGVCLIAACYGMARFAYGMFVPVFREEFGLDSTTSGAIASGSFLSYCVAIVAASLLTPRFGARTVAVAAGAIAVLGTLVIAAAPNVTVLAIGVLVAGSSTGIASPPLAHAVARTVIERDRSRTQTVINAGTGIGVAVAGPIALIAHDHWRLAWVAFAVTCALVTAWAAASVPAARGGSDDASFLPAPLLPVGSGRLILAAAAAGLASAAVWTLGREVLVTDGGLGETRSLVAWIILGCFGVVGAAAGDLIRRLGLRGAWLATMLAMAGGTALLGSFPGLVGVAWFAAAAFGASYIAVSGVLLLWGTKVYPEAPAAGVGLAFLVLALGQAGGSLLVGALAEAGAQFAFLTAAAVAVAGALVRPRA